MGPLPTAGRRSRLLITLHSSQVVVLMDNTVGCKRRLRIRVPIYAASTVRQLQVSLSIVIASGCEISTACS